MEKQVKDMEHCVKHFAPLERSFVMLPELQSAGYMPRKTQRICRSFESCNYSLILSGRGYYRLAEHLYLVQAPCVLLQWPWVPMDYGPEEGTSWEELYLIFRNSDRQRLRDSGTFPEEAFPVREFRRTPAWEGALETMRQLIASSRETTPEQVDLAAWQLILQTMVPPAPETVPPLMKKIEKILMDDFQHAITLQDLASEAGMSVSSLQRFWKKYGVSRNIRHFREQLFRREACRMLVETDRPVKEIAVALGIDDVYYFYRKFHEICGESARSYRCRHQQWRNGRKS